VFAVLLLAAHVASGQVQRPQIVPTTLGKVVRGRVLSGSAPAVPVVGARITLFTSNLSFFAETRTDQQGLYGFSTVPLGIPLNLGVAARDWAYQERSLLYAGTSLLEDFALLPETQPGLWSVIGNTLPEFFDGTDIALLTPQGKVFFCHDTIDPILFDPENGTKISPPGSPAPQGCTSATQFLDQRLVFIGGQSPADPGSFTNAVPWVKARFASGSWQWMSPLNLAAGRWYPGLARLADGSLLVMGGGMAPDAERTDTCERFDPFSETWSWTGSMAKPVEYPPSALLHDGRVLITWSPPQLYDVPTGTWSPTGDFVQPDRGWPDHSDHSIVVLADGRVLAAGIRKGSLSNPVMGELYDPAAGAWTLTSPAGLARKRPEVVQLPDGRVFVGAGDCEISPPVPDVLGIVKWCDLYDPATDVWRRVADMGQFREYHAVTLLVPDGRVITTGGTYIKFQFGPTSADVEAWQPPYLFRGVRPQIASISSTVLHRGDSISLGVFPATRVTSVVLMGFAAPTHWVDGGIPRRLELPVTQAGATATCTLPTDAKLVPLGWYQVFAMVDDIPSVARIVSVAD
jgi:hypothetical protein